MDVESIVAAGGVGGGVLGVLGIVGYALVRGVPAAIEWWRARTERKTQELAERTATVEQATAVVEQKTEQVALARAQLEETTARHQTVSALVERDGLVAPPLMTRVSKLEQERDECREELTAERILGVRRDAAIELLTDEVERRAGTSDRVEAIRELLRSTPTTPPEGPPLILVVDDDEQTLRTTERVLDDLELRSTGVATAAQALAHITAGGVAAVLCDVRMPGLSGTELVRKVRSLRIETPIVLVTGDPDGVAKEAAELKVEVLGKPWKPPQLEEVIARALASRPVEE